MSANSYVSTCPYQFDPFTRDLWQFQTNLESIWKLLRSLMAASLAERIDILTCVALVYILQYAHLNGVYFSQEYRAVEPKVEAMTHSRSPFIHPSISACIYLRPIHIQDQVHFIVWVEPVLPFTLVKELDHDSFVICTSWYRYVCSYL